MATDIFLGTKPVSEYDTTCGWWCVYLMTRVEDGTNVALGCRKDNYRVRFMQKCRHTPKLLDDWKRGKPRGAK